MAALVILVMILNDITTATHALKIKGEKAGDDLLEGLINNAMMPEMSPNVNKQADRRCHTVTAGVTSNLPDHLEVVLSTSLWLMQQPESNFGLW